MKQILFYLCILFSICNINAQQVIPLYKKIPNNIGILDVEQKNTDGQNISHVVKPTLTVYLPARERSNHVAVIICPGGGYSYVSMQREGYDIATKLSEMGCTAFVLKYRLPNDSIMTHKEICPLQDAQRSIQLVRENANEYNVDTAMVGIMGFSAGGHLAATASTHYQKSYIQNKKKTNLRPSFSILIYPVISFSEKITHMGSRINLIGNHPSNELINEFSNELHVNKDTPPAFLVLAQNDALVKPINSLSYFETLLSNKVPNCEMHIYSSGGHGFGLSNPNPNVHWMDQLQNWLSVIKKTLRP